MWARAFAGVIPGFFVSAGLVGLGAWLWPGPWQATLVPALIAFFPVWIGIIGTAFFFPDGRRAWAWLCMAAIASMGGLWLVQAMGWAQ
ncbi:MAG: hypothetical protein EOP02_39700 [Proteobacteria bacterium]|nr:MAG: hypothetical protein EOP02_39700 [Pseudomonadota bacterium]